MTDPSDMTPELADLAERLSKLDLDNPGDLEALFEMQEELGALTGIEVEAPISAADLPTIAPEPEPSDAYLAAADPTIPLSDFIDLVGNDIHETISTQSLLFPTCIAGSLEKATWLIDQGLDPDHRDKNGYSPLIYACLPGINANLDLIEFLIAKGADANASSSHNESPLRLSIRTGNYLAVRILIKSGADTDAFSPLHQAAATGDLTAITALVTPDTLEEPNTWKRTPWLTAIHADQTDAAQLLRSLGASTSALGHSDDTALHLAASSNAHNSIRYLLTLGFDVNINDNFQSTPLHEAADNDAIDAAEILLTAGANVHALTHTQNAPVSLACSIEMLSLLHVHGADLNFVSGEGRWPLWDFAECTDPEGVTWLLDNGADINTRSSWGTALHTAVAHDNLENIRILLAAGCDPNTKDCDGDTPLLRSNSISAAKLLLEAGADPTIRHLIGDLPSECRFLAPDVRNFIKSFEAN